MKLVVPLPYAYSTSPATFRLKLLYKLTLEGALHNKIKDFTTGNSIVIIYSNSKGRLISVHHDATVVFKTTVLVRMYVKVFRV